MMFAVVIEVADSDPRVVVFEDMMEAVRFRAAYEANTKGLWDGDPDWNHYPRHPERVMQPWEALEALRLSVEDEMLNRLESGAG